MELLPLRFTPLSFLPHTEVASANTSTRVLADTSSCSYSLCTTAKKLLCWFNSPSSIIIFPKYEYLIFTHVPYLTPLDIQRAYYKPCCSSWPPSLYGIMYEISSKVKAVDIYSCYRIMAPQTGLAYRTITHPLQTERTLLFNLFF